MVKSWENALLPEEEKMMAHLEAQIAMLKHKRYKIQNAASKRVSDAKKRKTVTVRRKPKAKSKPKSRKPRPIAIETQADSSQS
jgi:hypothetical protein